MIKICVIGLGYVGLPVALGISSKFKTIGFDTNLKRIQNLKRNYDDNSEFKKKDFNKKKIFFTNNSKDIKDCNFYIICLPTPINNQKIPDLKPLMSSIRILKNKLKKDDIIVLESTVYPGLTKSFSNNLSKKTGLKNNQDYYTCYSPERINPGDKTKNLNKIEKIFALETSKKLVKLKVNSVYKLISKKLIFSKHIAEAETAKAIENTQRDLNIALFNELLILSNKLNLKFNEVVRLASTKWNFLKFSPGLVGGHCLPVDPYYLSFISKKNNFKMNVALAGRSMNNFMRNFVVTEFNKILKKNLLKKDVRILIVGLSYKYGVADLRNSLNLKIYKQIKKNHPNTSFFDPFVNKKADFDKKKVHKFQIALFLTKGKMFSSLYKKMKKGNVLIIDPFKYYS